jgi:hypothetical protein
MYNNETKIKLIIGDGTYIVTAAMNALIFKQLDLQFDIGKDVSASNYSQEFRVIDIHTIPFISFLEIQELRKMLSSAYETPKFSFKGIQFDFSNYNRKSVDCILNQLTWIEHFIPRA